MTLFLLLLLAQVNPHLRLVSTKIYAPNQTIKPGDLVDYLPLSALLA